MFKGSRQKIRSQSHRWHNSLIISILPPPNLNNGKIADFISVIFPLSIFAY